MSNTNAQIVPGSLYGVPGFTNPLDEFDTTNGAVSTPTGGSSVVVNNLQPLKQTDVIFGWELFTTMASTYTVGAGQTATVSPFAPWNIFGPMKLSFQNQYNPIDVVSGRDLAIFQSYRPRWYNNDSRNALYANPVAGANYPVSTFTQAAVLQGTGFGTGTTASTFALRLPGSIELDAYYPLDIAGNVLGMPARGIISPQYMGGTTRIITPQFTLAQQLGTLDTSPVYTTAVTSATSDVATTYSGTASLVIRRKGVYSSNNPAALPPVQPWQYALHTTTYPLSGQAAVDIPLPNDTGQILSLWCLLWDPTANSNAGGAILLSTVSSAQLRYGSSLRRFDDNVASMQKRWIEQHNTLPPAGFIGWDMALQPDGRLSNSGAAGVLNTLTTNAITIHIAFNSGSSPSSTAYAIVGTEALQYVVPQ